METYACMYLRLSREDGDSNESNSISSQRQIIQSYAKENQLSIKAEYVDDGYTGSNFDRPQFKEMIYALEQKQFNTIIVKDLSRFGRDYIESGKYLQKVFPDKGIRFISVNDHYDSAKADVSDTHLILPIRNFINDSYCRDISMKVRSSKEVKRKNGEFIGAFAPFGYKKDKFDKHLLVIDTEVSHVVDRIFNMKIEGYSSKGIADFLNSIGEVTPLKHKENSGENFNIGFTTKGVKWDAKIINRIITNRVYIGTLEQGKTTKLNYKSKQLVNVAKEDWIRVENTHKGIVSKTTFLLANKMLLRDVKNSKEKLDVLTGMLYCRDCGSSMTRRKVKSKDGYKIFYICSEHKRTGECTRHSIKEEVLIKSTIQSLYNHLKEYKELLKKVSKLDVSAVTINVDFELLEAEKKKYEKLRQSLYSDLEEELITNDEFEQFRNIYLNKIRNIEKQISTKQQVVDNLKKKLRDKHNLISDIVPNPETEELNRLSLVSFIDKIEIGEKQTINYVFNHIDTVKLLQKIIEDEGSHKKEKQKTDSKLFSFGEKLESDIMDYQNGGIV